MEKFEKTIKYTKLFNLYSPLLSNAQQEILNDYYFLDLSISEISENRGISRAAVEDALSKGNKKLDDFESKLHNLEKHERIREKVEELQSIVDDKDEIRVMKELMEEIDNGIWEPNWKVI